MFRRLRLQFIMITSLAILFILIFTVGIINTVRSFQTEQEISKVLNILTENNGSFGKIKKIETNQGREIPSDSFRFFSLTLSDDKVVSQDTSHTFLINDEEAARYALTVSRLTNNLGTIREKNINLSYQVSKVSRDKILVVFWTRLLITILPKPCSVFLFFYHCLLLSFCNHCQCFVRNCHSPLHSKL